MEKNTARDLLDSLWNARSDRRRPAGRSSLAPCPVSCANSHQDRDPSFNINERGGKVLFNCKSRCTQAEALQGLIAGGHWKTADNERKPENVEPLPFEKNENKQLPDREWAYKNKAGEIIAYHGRWDTPTGKNVRWKKAGGSYSTGGVHVENLQLYNSEELESRKADPVMLVEGEPAADALISRGVLACTNGGGASQKRWGSSLEPLRNRDLLLFPDNDDAGKKLMEELIEQLKHTARSIRVLSVPGLPYKGDAVDFFAGGGTVEGLESTTRPVTEHLGNDRIRITIPTSGLSESQGSIVMLFESLLSRRGALDTDLTLTPPVNAIAQTKIRRRLNLRSSSALEALKREARTIYDKTIDWNQVIAEGVSLVSDALIDSESLSSLDLAASGDQIAPERWAVKNLIPAGGMSIWFGDSASLKTLNCHYLAVCMSSGRDWLGFEMADDTPRNCLIIDYENTFEVYKSYHLRMLLGANGSTSWPENRIRYMSASLPITEMLPRIVAAVRQHSTRFIIIDSAALASGGDPGESSESLAFFSAVRQLTDEEGCTVLVLAHVTKATRNENKTAEKAGGDHSRQAYGSVFWDTSARSSFFVRADTIAADHYSVIFRNRKQSRGPKVPSFAVDVHFDDPAGPITFNKGMPPSD